MKKTMTNGEIVAAVNRITAMQNRESQNNEKIFGSCIKINYAVKKNKDKLLSLLKPYDESYEELLQECKAAEPVGDNGEQKIRKDCQDRWRDGIKELQAIEVEADIHTVKFSDIERLSLSMNDLEAIEFMVEEPEGFGK